jgi:D-alanine-D-alanine ligase
MRLSAIGNSQSYVVVMRVAFLYNRAADDPALTADDDVPERSPLVAAIKRCGHCVTPIAATLDLATVQRELQRARPDVAFNRVESLGGSDAMMAAVTLLLDALRVPYTGCPTAALVATRSKLAVKERLVRAALPTPDWITGDGHLQFARCKSARTPGNRRPAIRNRQFILKSVYEHASFEMDDANIIGPAAPEEIACLVRERTQASRRMFFAERFVPGREFNLSLLGPGPVVLPPAEIDFSAFPPSKPRVVGHRAKWSVDSFEFQNTPRRYDFADHDLPLLRRLRQMAVKCWRLFGLGGYARIDFRCDESGRPLVLEVNANPCLAPGSGFAAALQQAAIGYDDAIQRILDDALARSRTAKTIRRRRSTAAR